MIGLCLVLCRLLGTLRWRPPLGPASPSSLLSCSEYLTGSSLPLHAAAGLKFYCLCSMFAAQFDEYLTTTDILQPGHVLACAGERWSGLILPPLSQCSTLTDEGGRELITLHRTIPILGNNCHVIFINQSTFSLETFKHWMHFLQHQKETFSFSLLDKDSFKILVNAMKDWMKNHKISVVCYQKYHVNTI